MKKLIGKLIYLLIMPCSKIPTLVEQEQAGVLPWSKRIHLKLHLNACKWCAVYQQKVRLIDSLLKKKMSKEQKKSYFTDAEIQSFKDEVKSNMKK